MPEETIEINKTKLIFILIGVVALFAVAIFVKNQPQPEKIQQALIDMKKISDDDAILGDKDAPITIVEFSDYQCPFCEKFHRESFSQIKDLVDAGTVRFIYRDFPLTFHQNAQKSAEAAECAGEQGKYYEMHEELFNQNSLLNEKGTVLSTEKYINFANKINIANIQQFQECIDSGKYRQEVLADMAQGSAAGIQGTPSFFIGKTNGQGIMVEGAVPFQTIEAAIIEAMK